MSEMTFAEFDRPELSSWLETSRAGYIAELIAAGHSEAEARANAAASTDKNFPDGVPRPGQLIGSLSFAGVRVGELWVGPAGDDPQRWWVWNVAIDEGRRGEGLGRKAMLLAEELATAHGATTLGLNVFAENTVARHLYQSLGYRETAVQMRKPLPAPS